MEGQTKIKVQGLLDKNWKEWFEGMEISYEANQTVLTGNLEDSAKLHGVLNRIRNLNLKLISVNPIEE